MPRRKVSSGWIPPLKPHTGPDGRVRARVWIHGQYHYCGFWGSAEAEETHRRLIAEWMANAVEPSRSHNGQTSVSILLDAFAKHAEQEYRGSNGKPVSELYHYRLVVGYVNELYGTLPICEFRPRHLKAVRAQLLAHRWSRRKGEDRATDPHAKPLSRRQVNQHVRRVVGIFRWGVEFDLVEPSVLHALVELKPLLHGKTTAPDHPEPEPVEWATVEKTLPHLTTDAAALVRVIWLTGARSGEICRLRTVDIDRSKPEWLYRPRRHKTLRHGKKKDIWFGKRSQEILRSFIAACQDDETQLFSTRDEPRAERWLPHYSPDSLADAISKACRKAGVEHWSPKQLRSGRATEVESVFDLEHAAAVLGDRLDTTRHHYAKAKAKARKVAREIG